jgi:2,3-bisphosphoglycerate-independent phosphoglycerate mutase
LSSLDVAILAHFISVSPSSDGRLILKDGKPQALDEEIRSLIHAVGEYAIDGVTVCLHHTHDFRGSLILKGQVSPYVTDSDPMLENHPLMAVCPWKDYADDPSARNTAQVLSAYLEWVYHTLKDHSVNTARHLAGRPPLNGLATQRAGRLKHVIPFSKTYGLRGLSIASGIVYHGLAAYLGLECLKVADTPHPGKDLSQRVQMAVEAIGEHDFIHVHTKMPDEAAHKKDPIYKTQIIEALDQGLGDVLEKLLATPELLLIVAADHSTPSSGPLIHSGEPVPLIFHGPGVRRDAVQQYDEVSAAGGALGFVRGKELMYLLLNHLDRAKLQGIMDTTVDQPYWPGRYKPFRLRKNMP